MLIGDASWAVDVSSCKKDKSLKTNAIESLLEAMKCYH